MRDYTIYIILTLLITGLYSCENKSQELMEDSKQIDSLSAIFFKVQVTELTDKEYPDNPDIGYRSDWYQKFSHGLKIKVEKDSSVSFYFYPKSDQGSEVSLKKVNLETFIPGVPEWLKYDSYLSYITIVNQEWNRQQVEFTREDTINLWIDTTGVEGKDITRVDLARNCLNSYLWEIAMWREEKGGEKVFYHGWFSFPEELYDKYVNRKSGIDFTKYKFACKEWVDPESGKINLSALRNVKSERSVKFKDIKSGMYPMKAARLKKFKNIIYPKNPTQIADFQTDKSRFATFSIPGYYNTPDPRKTELGRLEILNQVFFREITSPAEGSDVLFELELFLSDSHGRKTRFLFGGISKENIPTLALSDMNSGYKMPMGIANHSFYETYNVAVSQPMNENPYYGLILDENGNWLDSHNIGIDGPLLHWDSEKENVLHLWLLSFERHAFVGHYVIDINK